MIWQRSYEILAEVALPIANAVPPLGQREEKRRLRCQERKDSGDAAVTFSQLTGIARMLALRLPLFRQIQLGT
jgi:hypothetical protein